MTAVADLTFQSLAELFVDEYRSGRCGSVQEFAARHPTMASVILQEFPAIVFAEELRTPAGSSISKRDVPKKIGRYILQSQIGRGGMGLVYAAKHPDLDREVAIKLLFLEGLRDPAMLERFHLEARASAMLNHTNIVPVFDHGVESNLAYLVMRRIRGLSIDRIVAKMADDKSSGRSKGHQMDWNVLTSIGAQVASALSYAHEQGIVHRDIKPGNLILETADKVWVTDFGLAKLTENNLELSRTGDIIGTPKYMAPEQFRGLCDPRSDIYGLGLTLYELACGQRVWESISEKEIFSERSTLELPDIRQRNANIPESLCNIIMKCCALLPEDRYQTAAELNYVLNRYAHGSPVADRRRSNKSRSIWRRKSALLLISTVFLTSVGAVSGGISYFTKPENPFRNAEAAMKVLDDDKLRTQFVAELPGLIEQLLTGDDPKLRQGFGRIVADTLGQTINQFAIPQEEKNRLTHAMNYWIDAFKTGEIAHHEIGLVIQGMTLAPNADTAPLLALSIYISRSSLDSEAKAWVVPAVHRLYVGVAEGKVPKHDQEFVVSEINRRGDRSQNAHLAVPPIVDSDLLEIAANIRYIVDAHGAYHSAAVTPMHRAGWGSILPKPTSLAGEETVQELTQQTLQEIVNNHTQASQTNTPVSSNAGQAAASVDNNSISEQVRQELSHSDKIDAAAMSKVEKSLEHPAVKELLKSDKLPQQLQNGGAARLIQETLKNPAIQQMLREQQRMRQSQPQR